MQDELYTPPGAGTRKSGSARWLIAAALLAFVFGAGLVGWLAREGRLDFVLNSAKAASDAQLTMSEPAGATSSGEITAPGAPPPAAAQADGAATTGAPAAVTGPADARIAALEQRLTRLDLEAEAASGNASRAEGLLIAFAARRLIERGSPLGYLEDQLRLRFADAQPNAVDTLIAAARQPVTLDQLSARLDAMIPAMARASAQESGWDRLRRDVSGLFVIRHDSAAATSPQSRIDHAQLLLRLGRIDEAIAEVDHLPGSAAAPDWIAAARRYGTAQRALDLIEATAMLDTHRLGDANGRPINQASPLAPPPG